LALALALAYVALGGLLSYRGAISSRTICVNVLAVFPIVALLGRHIVLAEISLVLLGLLWLCVSVVRSGRVFGVSSADILAGILSYLLLALVFITGASLLRWALDPVFPSRLYDGASWHFSLTELELFYLGSILCPLFLVVIVAVVIFFPVGTVYFSSLVSSLGRVGSRLHDSLHDWLEGLHSAPLRFRLPLDARVSLLVAVLVSLVVACYPYVDSINPNGSFVGTDLVFYQVYLNKMTSTDLAGVISYAFKLLLQELMSLCVAPKLKLTERA